MAGEVRQTPSVLSIVAEGVLGSKAMPDLFYDDLATLAICEFWLWSSWAGLIQSGDTREIRAGNGRVSGMRQMTRDDLVAGDILLYRVTDSIRSLHSALIRKLDGTEVSHAGLFMGGCVAEALAVGEHAGLGTQPLTESIAGCDWVAVRRLRNVPGDMQPVLDTAQDVPRPG